MTLIIHSFRKVFITFWHKYGSISPIIRIISSISLGIDSANSHDLDGLILSQIIEKNAQLIFFCIIEMFYLQNERQRYPSLNPTYCERRLRDALDSSTTLAGTKSIFSFERQL